MKEGEARQGFRVRLEAVMRALARLGDNPLRHRKMIEDLEHLREQYQAELDRSPLEETLFSTGEHAKRPYSQG